MASRKRKKTRKCFKRIILVTIFCLAINTGVIYYVGNTLKGVFELKKEQQELNVHLSNLKEKEETLKVEVKRLQNPEYIAKYAREKFMYSGDNEYIIRIK